jgi:hypothetical protein
MRKTVNAFGLHWTIELRNGVGFDLEFVDSRPVWVNIFDSATGESSFTAMPFEGVIILLPFININIGRCYEEVDIDE